MTADFHRIIFEGTELPNSAIHLDHLGMYNNLPGVSEAASEWIWRFVICVGKPCRDTSANVIRHSTELLDLAIEHRAHLLENFPKKFTGIFTEKVYQELIASLMTMIERARRRTECHWTAPLLTTNTNYGRSWDEISKEQSDQFSRFLSAWNKKRKPGSPD